MPQLSPRFLPPLALLACVTAIPVAAKEKDPSPRPAQVQELYGCRDIADPTERLACFDRAVGDLATADSRREISFSDRATMKKARRGLFGFSLPNLGALFGGDDSEEEQVTSIDTTIKAVSMNGAGKYRLTLEDDAVWMQIDGMGTVYEPRPGQKIHIKAAALGSYLARIQGGRAFRIRRER